MSKKVLIVISTVMIVVLGTILIYLWTFRKADLSVSSKKADFEISAAELLESYESDEESANAAYLDKIIIVTGLVDHIYEDSLSVTVYLKNEDSFSGVLCSFDKSVISTNRPPLGKEVIIKGICSGYLLDVVLNKCSFVK